MHGKVVPDTCLLLELTLVQDAASNLYEYICPNIYDVYAIGSQECERSIPSSVFNASKEKWTATVTELLGDRYGS